jgi:hypothetical protein
MEKKNGGHGSGGRGGAAVNRFPDVKAPAQRPADVTKGGTHKATGKEQPKK